MTLLESAQVDYQDATAAVTRHDARDLPLPDDSVDLIVTSPPYFALRSYRDDGDHYDGQLGSEDTPAEFIDNLVACMAEWVRVLKPSGSIFVNLGDKYSGGGNGPTGASSLLPDGTGERTPQPTSVERQAAMGGIPAKSRMLLPHRFAIACIDQLGLICRMDMVWSKPNGLPESVTDRVRAAHENWFHFVKEPRYFTGLDEIREPGGGGQSGLALSFDRPNSRNPQHIHHGGEPREDASHPLGRVPGSVWTIPTEPLLVPDEIRQARNLPDHFAAFPQEWPRRLILGFAPTGICTVCDEPRRAEVDQQATGATEVQGASRLHGKRNDEERHAGRIGEVQAIITGYACGCPPVGDLPPTRPAVVLDPFGGTGTVAGVARTLGRYGISNDLSADYNRLATWRIWESGHFTKTEQRMWRDRQGTML